MPDDQSQEKYMALERLQARIEKVRPASIIDPRQFVNRAKLLANEDPKGYFSDQFENLANYRAHLKHTGPEIWEQTGGNIDAFVMGAGTGGTLAGITEYIKTKKPDLKVLLVDPTGSGLYYKVKANTFFSPLEKEGSRKRHQVDTIVEGVGINRLTQNFSKALPNVDDAVTVTDREAVLMARFILKKDGLFIGSSTALNLVGSYKLAKKLGPGKTIVTLLCDSGLRHHTKFW
jgi:cysteine synthase A